MPSRLPDKAKNWSLKSPQAEQLYRSVKTIEKHRANIKRKLNMDSSHDLTRFAIQWTRNGDPDFPTTDDQI